MLLARSPAWPSLRGNLTSSCRVGWAPAMCSSNRPSPGHTAMGKTRRFPPFNPPMTAARFPLLKESPRELGAFATQSSTRQERTRAADQRKKHHSDDEERADQQQQVVVRQHKRLALHRVAEHFKCGPAGVSGDKPIEAVGLRFKELLYHRAGRVDVLDQSAPVKMHSLVHQRDNRGQADCTTEITGQIIETGRVP